MLPDPCGGGSIAAFDYSTANDVAICGYPDSIALHRNMRSTRLSGLRWAAAGWWGCSWSLLQAASHAHTPSNDNK
jgi:hypothetical protein